jgi:hypothetical protein
MHRNRPVGGRSDEEARCPRHRRGWGCGRIVRRFRLRYRVGDQRVRWPDLRRRRQGDQQQWPVARHRDPGRQLPATDQCQVTGSRSANFLDSSGTNSGGRVLLYLNCNNSFAAAGVPGNSIGSPEGRQARQDYEDKLAEAQAQAQQSDQDELLQTGNVPGDAGQVAGG